MDVTRAVSQPAAAVARYPASQAGNEYDGKRVERHGQAHRDRLSARRYATAHGGKRAARKCADDHDHRVPAWLRTELVDVNNGEAFTLADFAGTPVLLESFAPWCPVCISQQLQIEGLHDTPTSIVSVSLDADPYEPWGPVVRHSSSHGFTDYDHWGTTPSCE